MNNSKQKAYDEWLVLQCQFGDKDALNELLKKWRSKFIIYATNQVRNSNAAEDISQECLIAISKGIWRIKDPASFPKWAYQILVRRVRDWIKLEIKSRNTKATIQQHTLAPKQEQNLSNEYELLQYCISKIEPEVIELAHFSHSTS